MRQIETIGVIGAGTMGAALAQKFAMRGFAVVLCDRTRSFVDCGLASVARLLAEAVGKNIVSSDEAQGALERVSGTDRLGDLARCDMVIEAIFEDLNAKSNVLSRLGAIVCPDTIVATNTSSFLVADLARAISHPERFLGLHFFYQASKNRLVEIVPGPRTCPDAVNAAVEFCARLGQETIACRDRHGFAVDRFFVPWLNEAARLLEEGIAPAAAIDAVCRETFGAPMGPFTVMNRAGIPFAYFSQKTLEILGNFYSVADRLREQASLREPWTIDERATSVCPDVERVIRERMLGAVFLACAQIMDEDVCTPADLDRGALIGLKWANGPLAMMRATGRDEVERLVRITATRYQTPFPRGFRVAFVASEPDLQKV